MIFRLQTIRVACLVALIMAPMAIAQDGDSTPSAEADATSKDKSAGGADKDKPADATGKPGAAPASGGENTILPTPQGGDKIYMKSGKVMSGVQVLKSDPANYEVQIIVGEPPMQIPRRQVDRVEYDDVDPLREQMREKMFPKPKEVTMASGERVTSELRDKLEAPVAAEQITYKDQDVVAVLNDIKTKTGVKLTVDPSIEERPAGQRKWSIEIPAGRTLMAVLREDMVARFNYVEVIFETDTVLVMTKEAAAKRAEANKAAGAADAPAAEAPGAAATPAPAPAQTPPAAPPAAVPSLRKPKAPGTK